MAISAREKPAGLTHNLRSRELLPGAGFREPDFQRHCKRADGAGQWDKGRQKREDHLGSISENATNGRAMLVSGLAPA